MRLNLGGAKRTTSRGGVKPTFIVVARPKRQRDADLRFESGNDRGNELFAA